MTFQSPYQPPIVGNEGSLAGPTDLAKPSRRAGLLMIVVGAMLTLVAIGIASMGVLMPRDQVPPNVAEQISRIERELGVSWETMLKVAAVFAAAPAITMIVLGLFVRRGGLVSAVLGVVLTSIMALYVLSMFVQATIAMLRGTAMGAGSLMVFCGAMIALLAVQIVWLAKAVINAGPLKVFSQQYQTQAWQLDQQRRASQSQQQSQR